MPGFSGTILLPGETGAGLQATAYLDSDRLTLTCATGQLGAWPISKVTVEREAPDRFALGVEGERIVFLPEEPEGFARVAPIPSAPNRPDGSENGPPEESLSPASVVRLDGEPEPEPVAPEPVAPEPVAPEPADPFAGLESNEDQDDPEAVEGEDDQEPSVPPPIDPPVEARAAQPGAGTHRVAEQSRSLLSESAATIALVVLLAVLGTAGVALMLGSWNPFGGEEEPAPVPAALPARSVGDLGVSAEEMRVAWNRSARRIGSDLRIPSLIVDRRPETDVFRHSFGRHLLVTGVTDGTGGPVREISVVATPSDARTATQLVDAWHLLLAATDETLDEASRRRILHELGAFTSEPTGGTVVFGNLRYTLVVSPAVGTWLTVTPAG